MTAHSPMQWTCRRIARLGFLIGLGWSAKRVAEDSIIATDPNNVHQRAKEFGLSFREAQTLSLDLSPEAHRRFGDAAERRGLSRDGFACLLLRVIAEHPYLAENILDDDDDVREHAA